MTCTVESLTCNGEQRSDDEKNHDRDVNIPVNRLLNENSARIQVCLQQR